MDGDSVKLKTIFEKVAKTGRTVDVDVVLLFDASGSVSDSDFSMALNTGVRLRDTFSTHVRMGALQFSTRTYVASPLTDNAEHFKNILSQTQKHSGGTNTSDALRTATTMLGNTTGERYAFLFTDGYPNSQEDAIRAGREMMERGIHLVGVGIGNVHRPQLEAVCGGVGANTILLSDWGTLEAVVASISPKTSTNIISGSDVRIVVNLAVSPVGMKDNLYLHLTIRNMGEDIIPKGTRIEVGFPERKRSEHADDDDEGEDEEEDLCFEPDLKVLKRDINVGKRLRVPDKDVHDLEEEDLEECFVLEPVASLSLLRVNPRISIRLVEPRTRRQFEVTTGNRIVIPLKSFLGDVFRWKPPVPKGIPPEEANEAVNILFFGWTGSGKSSLLNGIMSCFSGAKEELAAVMESEKQVTKVTKQYTTDMLEGMRRLNVQLWDSPGVDPNAYVGDVFNKMMEGAYRRYNLYQELHQSEDDDEDDDEDEDDEDEDDILEREKRTIHCVVFVASQGGVDDDVQMRRLREFVEETTTKGMNAILVVTHMDEIPDDPNEKRKLKRRFQSQSGVPGGRIVMIKNEPDAEKTFDHEKQFMEVLLLAMQRAADYIRAHLIAPR
eukprot:TRINITY_DN146_c6_g1_i1.p1 TRINITY_DN146_c6_g1~~TRINITY_DN146_c6_g1_i1.p1  ORF type:complete len:609 (+),score=217.00 TRINITY_DN146_c6_g1_i1:182-2008(+)